MTIPIKYLKSENENTEIVAGLIHFYRYFRYEVSLNLELTIKIIILINLKILL